MSTHVPLVLLSALLLLHSLAAAQSPEFIADVQITSITGCVDVPPVTVNCSVGTTTLRIQTANGFPATRDFNYQPVYLDAHLNEYSYFSTTAVWPDLNDPTNSSVFVNITAGGYYPHITDALISVSFVDYYSGDRLTSPPFAGFSYRFEGPPTLTSIGGCDGSGQSTQNCVPDSATIELTGSGLLWYQSAWSAQLTIGNKSTVSGSSLRVVNDTYATLSLAWIYTSLLQPQHYAGVLLPLNFTSLSVDRSGVVQYSYTTNSLYISFVPLPPPSISTWFLTSCNATTSGGNLTQYTGCLPRLSEVRLYGSYLYEARVSVGGALCAPSTSYSNPSQYFCRLPEFDFDPSVAYDIVVYNDAGNRTLSGAVQYTAAPILASVDPCIDRGEGYESDYDGVQCAVGTTITLRGSRFPVADAVTVQFTTTPFFTPPVTVTLLSPTVVDSSTITATLPALDDSSAASVYNQRGTVQAVFTSSGITTATNALNQRLYIAPDAPNITSVTSTMCDSVSPLQLTNCRAMASITIVGTNLERHGGMFLPTSLGGEYLGPYTLLPSNSTLDFSRNDSVVFTLKYFDADTNVDLQANVVYTVYLTSVNGIPWKDSNAFRLSLTYSTADTDTTDSTSKLSSGAIAGIVIAVVVMAALLVAVVMRRARRSGSSASWSSKSAGESLSWTGRSGAQSGSSDYKDVELK